MGALIVTYPNGRVIKGSLHACLARSDSMTSDLGDVCTTWNNSSDRKEMPLDRYVCMKCFKNRGKSWNYFFGVDCDEGIMPCKPIETWFDVSGKEACSHYLEHTVKGQKFDAREDTRTTE